MDQAIDGGERHGGIGKDLSPFAEGLVGGDQYRPSFVSGADELEQHTGLGLKAAKTCSRVSGASPGPESRSPTSTPPGSAFRLLTSNSCEIFAALNFKAEVTAQAECVVWESWLYELANGLASKAV
jgi:hypothetical protein